MALVTAPDRRVARRIARAILESRAAACVNIVPGLESHYWWQGKLERGSEVLLLIKTTRAKLAWLEKTVLANHPYDTPEFIVVGVESGNERYLEWIGGEVE
jgi:periplasmic divalent cation tolerance protein